MVNLKDRVVQIEANRAIVTDGISKVVQTFNSQEKAKKKKSYFVCLRILTGISQVRQIQGERSRVSTKLCKKVRAAI